jgi:hypothetical protein
MTWIMAILAMLGTVLNIYRVRFCFVLWGTTNIYWVIHNLQIGENAQAMQFVFYTGTSIWGYYEWSRISARPR